MTARHFIVVSDLHCGSSVALCPPGMVSVDEGTPLPQNDWQKWLWENWLDFWRWTATQVGAGDDVTLIVNGDLIEGNHHRSVQAWPETADHVTAAVNVLLPIVQQVTRAYVVIGTEAHTKSAEHGIARAISAAMHPDGRYAADVLEIEVGDQLLVWAHHCSTTSRAWLTSGEPGRLISNARLAAVNAGHRPPNFVGAAHRHRMDYWTDGGRQHCMIGPAWQLLTRYGYKVVTHERPHIGGYIVTVDGGQIEVKRKRYDVPERKRVTL